MAISTPREIQIPVPYGFIAAQEWGPKDGIPTIAIHGWMDNCGTFEKLIPLLSPDLHVIAIDEPGVGLSSRLPMGAIIHYEDLVYEIYRIMNYFRWDKIILMGHSRGALISYFFAGIFPEKVEKIISLDMFKLIAPNSNELMSRAHLVVQQYLEMEKKCQQQDIGLSPKDALELLMCSHEGSLTEESAKIMLKRGTKKEGANKLVFTRDLRLRGFNVLNMDEVTMTALLSRMRCELLVIRAKKGVPLTPAEKQKWLESYGQYTSRFVYEEVDGTHHVHLNQPQLVAPLINAFLNGDI